jgi:integrase
MSAFSSKIGSAMTAFLDYRSALGYSRVHFRQALQNLDDFIVSEYPSAEELSGGIVSDWVDAQIGNRDQKTSCIRLFGEYLNSVGQTAYVLPRGRTRAKKATGNGKSEAAYIFTDDEMRRLFVSIESIPDNRYEPMLREMFPVMMRLTYTCGLRPNESRVLKYGNINFNTGTILITETKCNKERIVVMSPDMLARVREYEAKRAPLSHGSEYFFPKWDGGVFEPRVIQGYFFECWKRANPNVYRDELPRVRVYDLRHRFATSAIIRWINSGAELGAKLAYLQAFMGHESINETLYYAHFLPEHLVKSSGVDWSDFNEIVPEVTQW